MKASIQRIGPVLVIRLHESDDGDPLFLDDYVGLAVVVRRGDLGVVQGFCVPVAYDKDAREAMRIALRAEGITTVRMVRVREGKTHDPVPVVAGDAA